MKQFVVVCLLMMLIACSPAKNVAVTFGDNNLVAKAMAVEMLVKNPKWGAEINKVCKVLLMPHVAPASLDAAWYLAGLEIDKLGLQPANRELAYAVLDSIVIGLQQDFKRRGIVSDQDQMLSLNKFLSWLELASRPIPI